MSYIIDYPKALNPAQLEAVTYGNGPLLVIAGAGSGKTRTLVYRLARLVEDGVDPSQILLLTFTRKAAAEMTKRAALLLAGGNASDFSGSSGTLAPLGLSGAHHPASSQAGHSSHMSHAGINVRGGTFHAFAYSVLRRFRPQGYEGDLSLMDGPDILSALQHCKEKLELGKGDRSFPKNQTIVSFLSKCRNKESSLEDVLRGEAMHLMPYADDLSRIGSAYTDFKHQHCLLDYDDLLFELENLFVQKPEVLELQRGIFSHIMVDEYQDTNRVQARLTKMLAGEGGNILAVGDDAQSVYAFRGADVQNILDFPKLFSGAKVITLEENYRSVQPVLDLTNSILLSARQSYPKNLFTRLQGGSLPKLIKPISDMSQSNQVVQTIKELLFKYPAREIAVLFRAGYHSYHVEVQLTREKIPFRKYGGLRYTDAAHIKDVLSLARLVLNPLDLPSFVRVAGLFKGIGPKTAQKLYTAASTGAKSSNSPDLAKAGAKFPEFLKLLDQIVELRHAQMLPGLVLERLIEAYEPLLKTHYPDDYPYRQQALEELLRIAQPYDELDLLISDLSLEDPGEEQRDEQEEAITLSTVHSAKGLEWSAVLIIDLVQNRFPSRHAVLRDEDYEEERRLLYVACTRAKEELYLYAPATLYHRESGGHEPVNLSPFLNELPRECYEEWVEGYGGELRKRKLPTNLNSDPFAPASSLGIYSSSPSLSNYDQRGSVVAGSQFVQERQINPTLDVYGARPDVRSNPSGACYSNEAGQAFGSMNDFPKRNAERMGTSGTDPKKQEEPEKGSSLISPLNMPKGQSGYCSHKIFGRGKIIQHIPPDKYRVNFPGFGLKVIMANFLVLEHFNFEKVKTPGGE